MFLFTNNTQLLRQTSFVLSNKFDFYSKIVLFDIKINCTSVVLYHIIVMVMYIFILYTKHDSFRLNWRLHDISYLK